MAPPGAPQKASATGLKEPPKHPTTLTPMASGNTRAEGGGEEGELTVGRDPVESGDFSRDEGRAGGQKTPFPALSRN